MAASAVFTQPLTARLRKTIQQARDRGEHLSRILRFDAKSPFDSCNTVNPVELSALGST